MRTVPDHVPGVLWKLRAAGFREPSALVGEACPRDSKISKPPPGTVRPSQESVWATALGFVEPASLAEPRKHSSTPFLRSAMNCRWEPLGCDVGVFHRTARGRIALNPQRKGWPGQFLRSVPVPLGCLSG